jgi:hypothetical protein
MLVIVILRLRQVSGEYGGTILEAMINITATRQDNNAPYWCEVEYTYANGTKVLRKAPPRVLNLYCEYSSSNFNCRPIRTNTHKQ